MHVNDLSCIGVTTEDVGDDRKSTMEHLSEKLLYETFHTLRNTLIRIT